MTAPAPDPRPGRELALLAAALLVLTALVRVPLELYRASARDFASLPRDLLSAVIATGLVSFAALALSIVVLPRRLRRIAEVLLLGLAGYAWVRAGFFPGPSLNLDGSRMSSDLSTGTAGVLVPLAGAVCLAWLGARRRRAAAILLVVLLAGGSFQSVAATLASSSGRDPTASASVSSLFEWSRKGNVLVLILDTLQSDVFAEVLEAEPELHRRLDGFRYFRHALSSSPTTYLSLPAIHSGELYDPSRSASDFFYGSIRERSVLNRFVATGRRSAYASGLGTCPDAVASCLFGIELSYSRPALAAAEVPRLLDLGLYRVLPDVLRRPILQHGPIATAVAGRFRTNGDAAALERFARSSFATDSPPTAKIFHSMLTHPPGVVQADCTPGERDDSREATVLQARCALRLVVALVERLKQERIYDVSDLVVVGDHGHFDSRFAVGTQDPKFRRMVGSMNPVVLVKPARARGPLVTSDAAIALVDLAGALCASATACSPTEGLQALDSVDPGRERVAFWYVWHNPYWNLPRIPGLVRYSVRGPLLDPRSWSRDAAAYEPGTVIDFRRGGNAAVYLGVGWGRRQPTDTRMVDPQATIRLGTSLPADRDYRLVIRAARGGHSSAARAVVEVNGVEVGALPCADPDQGFETHQLGVPGPVLARAPETVIRFTLGPAAGGDTCLAVQTLELRAAS